jgi:hypothetical protein
MIIDFYRQAGFRCAKNKLQQLDVLYLFVCFQMLKFTKTRNNSTQTPFPPKRSTILHILQLLLKVQLHY